MIFPLERSRSVISLFPSIPPPVERVLTQDQRLRACGRVMRAGILQVGMRLGDGHTIAGTLCF